MDKWLKVLSKTILYVTSVVGGIVLSTMIMNDFGTISGYMIFAGVVTSLFYDYICMND